MLLLLPRGVMGIVHDLRQPAGAAPARRHGGVCARCWSATMAAARAGPADQPGVVGAHLVSGSPLLALARSGAGPDELRRGFTRVSRATSRSCSPTRW